MYVDGVCVEDQRWLWPVDDVSDINFAELKSILKGISLVMSWKIKCFRVMTVSSSDFNLVKSVIGRDCKIKARGLSGVWCADD